MSQIGAQIASLIQSLGPRSSTGRPIGQAKPPPPSRGPGMEQALSQQFSRREAEKSRQFSTQEAEKSRMAAAEAAGERREHEAAIQEYSADRALSRDAIREQQDVERTIIARQRAHTDAISQEIDNLFLLFNSTTDLDVARDIEERIDEAMDRLEERSREETYADILDLKHLPEDVPIPLFSGGYTTIREMNAGGQELRDKLRSDTFLGLTVQSAGALRAWGAQAALMPKRITDIKNATTKRHAAEAIAALEVQGNIMKEDARAIMSRLGVSPDDLVQSPIKIQIRNALPKILLGMSDDGPAKLGLPDAFFRMLGLYGTVGEVGKIYLAAGTSVEDLKGRRVKVSTGLAVLEQSSIIAAELRSQVQEFKDPDSPLREALGPLSPEELSRVGMYLRSLANASQRATTTMRVANFGTNYKAQEALSRLSRRVVDNLSPEATNILRGGPPDPREGGGTNAIGDMMEVIGETVGISAVVNPILVSKDKNGPLDEEGKPVIVRTKRGSPGNNWNDLQQALDEGVARDINAMKGNRGFLSTIPGMSSLGGAASGALGRKGDIRIPPPVNPRPLKEAVYYDFAPRPEGELVGPPAPPPPGLEGPPEPEMVGPPAPPVPNY